MFIVNRTRKFIINTDRIECIRINTNKAIHSIEANNNNRIIILAEFSDLTKCNQEFNSIINHLGISGAYEIEDQI